MFKQFTRYLLIGIMAVTFTPYEVDAATVKPKKPMAIEWQNWKAKPSPKAKQTAFPVLSPATTEPTSLKGQINQTLFLPPEMYGRWSIRAVVTQSDAPMNEFQVVSQEIWSLEREGDKVTIENVVNNAKASVHVDKVEDNMATFHHQSNASDGSFIVIETPTVAVRHDSLVGTNDQTYIYFERGIEVKRYHLKVNVTGARLAKQSRQFAPEVTPHFEIEPMQKESAN